MARPKAAPHGRGKAQGSKVGYPTLQDVLQSRGVFPGVRVPVVGEEQPVKLENGRVMHMREETWQEDHSGVQLENGRVMHMREETWQEDHSGVQLENGRVMHMREETWQEDHGGVQLENGRVMHMREETWQEDHGGVQLENGRVMHMRMKKEATWQEDHSEVEHAGQQEDRLEKKSSLVGGGSSSLNMESAGEDLGGSDQNLASEEVVHGCVMPQGRQNFGRHEDDAQFVCTACGRSVAIVEVQAHPVLRVGVCEICYHFLFSSPFTKDNPQDPFEHENECRWCGDGGEVILCDTCPRAFCKPCIKRNFGEEILNAIESPAQKWSCFVCDDFHLQTLISDFKNVKNLVKTMTRSSQPQKSRTSRESNSRMRSRRPRRRTTNETTLASETIATIIAGKKENLRRRYPETNFTGFEILKERRRPQHHFLFAQNNTKREHDTSKRGNPIPEVHVL